MASLACGRRLSLRNQYDTKTPRARIFFCCARQTDGTVIRAIRRPSREKPGTCSRHEKSYSVGFEMSVENFLRKKYSKNSLRDPESLPDYCRSKCCKRQQSHFQT